MKHLKTFENDEVNIKSKFFIATEKKYIPNKVEWHIIYKQSPFDKPSGWFAVVDNDLNIDFKGWTDEEELEDFMTIFRSIKASHDGKKYNL